MKGQRKPKEVRPNDSKGVKGNIHGSVFCRLMEGTPKYPFAEDYLLGNHRGGFFIPGVAGGNSLVPKILRGVAIFWGLRAHSSAGPGRSTCFARAAGATGSSTGHAWASKVGDRNCFAGKCAHNECSLSAFFVFPGAPLQHSCCKQLEPLEQLAFARSMAPAVKPKCSTC